MTSLSIFLIAIALLWICRKRRHELTRTEAGAIAAIALYSQLTPEQRAQAEDYVINLAAKDR
jgi:hypothetical protein